MDITPAGLIVSLIASTIGFSLFLYGKKQARVPQLVSGIALMGLPLAARDPLWLGVTSAVITAGLWLAVRAGF